MKGNIEERACELAAYMIENRATVRDAAKRFGISKSTVHMDIIKQNGSCGRSDRRYGLALVSIRAPVFLS